MTSSKSNRHPRGMRGKPGTRKEKRTFSLSVEALAYLDALAEDYRSASEALDSLIREKRAEAERNRVSASIRNYYDSISEDEREENRAWGEFVESQLAEE
ncbi:MAG TPA: hypothetical protein VEI26_03290 [Terriglobales bacterium]|nr:hypothetical protein [Terriglobales bacterium]